MLKRLREAKLYVRPQIYDFTKAQFLYLGFEISAEGTRALTDKAKAIV